MMLFSETQYHWMFLVKLAADYMVVSAVVIVIRFHHTAVQKVLFKKAEEHSGSGVF